MACVLHASDRGSFEDCIRSVGKQAGDESGKDPVNENDEEICCACRREARLHRDRSCEFQFTLTCALVIVRSEATKQSMYPLYRAMDCFAAPVIGRRFAPTRWLAMTVETRPRAMKLKCPGQARASCRFQIAIEKAYAWLATVLPSAACAAARRAIGTR